MPSCPSAPRPRERLRAARVAALLLPLAWWFGPGTAVASAAPVAAWAEIGDATVDPSPPANRSDLQEWLAYQRALGSPSLPAAAQLFFRRGVETLRSGAQEDGVRMLRGACILDPAFLAPHLALLGHFAIRDMSQALLELARIVDLAKTHFALQHYLVMNFVFHAALAVFVATLVAALFVVWRRRETLRHAYEEFLRQSLSPRIAVAGAWALLALPYLAGAGLAIPTTFTLAALWPSLRRSERALFFMLLTLVVAIPLGNRAFAHVALPDHPEQPPFFGTTDLAQAPFSEARLTEVRDLTRRHPDNPFVHFATGWLAARGRHYALSKEEFEAAGRLWPREPRIPNNLGNLAEIAGRTDEAEQLYREASRLDPDWAMPHYNLGQLYTRVFRYAKASEELARATSFDFDLVRNLQGDTQAHPGDPLPAAWGWLPPSIYWDALWTQRVPQERPQVPPGWDAWLELAGMAVAVLAVLLTFLGAILGVVLRAKLPVRPCSNCDEAVCRRCAERRRDRAYCAGCSAALREATTPEFARLLLGRRRRTLLRRRYRWVTALAALMPGFGPLWMDRLGLAWAMLIAAAAGFSVFLDVAGPFPYDARLGPLSPSHFNIGAAGMLALIYLVSLGLYLILRAVDHGNEVEPEAPKKPMSRLPRAA